MMQSLFADYSSYNSKCCYLKQVLAYYGKAKIFDKIYLFEQVLTTDAIKQLHSAMQCVLTYLLLAGGAMQAAARKNDKSGG